MKIYKVKVNGKVYEVELEAVSEVSGTIAPAAKEVVAAAPVANASASANVTDTTIKAPMQGNILKVNASVGQVVKKGDVVVVLEAMKLENDIVAPVNGTVKQVLVNKGQTVNNQDALLIIG